MAGDTVQQIKDKLSITDVVSQYVRIERSGANFRARCPFHAERSPSFFVSPERGTFHCFGCNTGGDIFTFVQQIEGLDFKGALKVLAEKAGVPLDYARSKGQNKDERDKLFELLETAVIFYMSRLNEPVKKYLKERGITEETMRAFRLGFAGEEWSAALDYLRGKSAGGGSSSGGTFADREIVDAGLAKKGEKGFLDKFRNRIMFPIADSAGRVVGFSGRIFGPEAHPDAPKYLNSPETPLFRKSRILYGFDKAKQAMRKHNCAILVEGQMDLLASYQAGWANTVAVSGTAFTPEHAALLKRMTDNLVVALDPDEAGFKAAVRAARVALAIGLNVKVAEPTEGFDPAEFIQKKGTDAWRRVIREAKDVITFLLDVLEKHAKDKSGLRREVEAVVLPFLSEVSSPIAREQYVREIAERLGVSEHAVAESLARVPRTSTAVEVHGVPKVPQERMQEPALSAIPIKERAQNFPRTRLAYAIFLWQQALDKPSIELGQFSSELLDALGDETFNALETLSNSEKETLRFQAERMYSKATVLKREIDALILVILRDRLSAELTEATKALKEAEQAEDEEKAAVHMSVCKLLTARIAQLHEPV